MIELAAHGLLAPATPPRAIRGVPARSGTLLDALVREHPDRDDPGRSERPLHGGELEEAATSAASARGARGPPGDPGGGLAAERRGDRVAFLGAMKLGAIWVGDESPAGRTREGLHAPRLRDRASSRRPRHGRAGAIAAGVLPDLGHVTVAPGQADDVGRAARTAASDRARDAVPSTATAPAAIAYTSGTTGFPKGAVHTQHNLLLPGTSAHRLAAAGWDPLGRCSACPLPLTILNLMILGPAPRTRRERRWWPWTASMRSAWLGGSPPSRSRPFRCGTCDGARPAHPPGGDR
jgi:long-chain acyl-CoA synthetase